jgi:hypothetical protein
MLFDPQKWVMPQIPEVEPENVPWRKLLLDAADLIEKKGWCRNAYQTHGRYCVVGAMSKALGYKPSICDDLKDDPPLILEAERHVVAFLNEGRQDERYDSIPEWNDGQKRGKVVIETLRKVATS